jgi:hypothetical protein
MIVGGCPYCQGSPTLVAAQRAAQRSAFGGGGEVSACTALVCCLSLTSVWSLCTAAGQVALLWGVRMRTGIAIHGRHMSRGLLQVGAAADNANSTSAAPAQCWHAGPWLREPAICTSCQQLQLQQCAAEMQPQGRGVMSQGTVYTYGSVQVVLTCSHRGWRCRCRVPLWLPFCRTGGAGLYRDCTARGDSEDPAAGHGSERRKTSRCSSVGTLCGNQQARQADVSYAADALRCHVL